MNNFYFMLVASFVLGQIGYAAVSIYIMQAKYPNINYWQAASQYFQREFAGIVMAACGWTIIMYIASEWVDVSISRKDLLVKETLSLKEKLIVFQRTISVILGAFIQHILYVAFKKGKKAIHDYATKNDIDANV